MKYLTVPRAVDGFLSRKLSGSVFNWRMIGVLLLPLVMDSLFSNMIALFASAMVSQNGEASVAAVSLVSPLCTVITNVTGCIVCGGSVIIVQYYGKGNVRRMRESIGMTLWISLAACILLALPMIIFPRQTLMLLYPEAEQIVLDKAAVYLVWNAFSTIPFAFVTITLCIFRAIGQTSRAMITNITCNVSHLIFSILFLNILNMDILGCSLALFLARLIGGGLGVLLLLVWRPQIKLYIKDILFFDKELFGSMMRTSIPFSIDMTIGSVGNVLISAYMIPLGTTALATHSIANQMMVMLYSVPYASVNLVQILVGRCIGAGKNDEAYTYGNRCVQLYMLIQVVAAAVFFMLLPALLQLFQASEAVSAMTTKLLLCSLPGLTLFFSCCNVYTETIRSAGDSRFITVVSGLCLLLITAGLGYVLGIVLDMGLMGVWLANWISWLVRGSVLWLRFRSRAWLRHKLLK